MSADIHPNIEAAIALCERSMPVFHSRNIGLTDAANGLVNTVCRAGPCQPALLAADREGLPTSRDRRSDRTILPMLHRLLMTILRTAIRGRQ